MRSSFMKSYVFGYDFYVDLVFCIDARARMNPLINTLKENISCFYRDFIEIMDKKHRKIGNLRVRIILFRDFLSDGQESLLMTKFLDLPERCENFEKCIRAIKCKGGGSEPGDGLEALAYAIRSDWDTEHYRRRQLIVFFSDDAAHELGFSKDADNYPRGMAENFEKLSEWWGSKDTSGFMSEAGKRLLFFTPDLEPWRSILENWNNAINYECKAGSGGSEINYDQILKVIAHAI